MAKTLGAKTLLIRDALRAHPDKGPKEIADLINASDARQQDKIEVKPIDVSRQKLALMQAAQAGPAAAEPARKKPGRKPGRKPGNKATDSSTTTSSHGAPAAAPVAAKSLSE